ncbi:MAG TPA: hypothetical protein VIP70_13125 [Nitrososphaeraceae archaeon]
MTPSLAPSRKINIPVSARAGIVLLLVGAITVGIGSYLDRGAISIYGLIMAIGGFSIYLLSSIMHARENKKTKREKTN